MTDPPTRTVRIAVAQYEPRIGDLSGNRSAAVAHVGAAAERGAQLVILPELASSGYVFGGEEEAGRLAEDADTGESVVALVDACRRHGVYVVGGLAEAGDGCRHNSAVVLGPEGRLATYRKLHLFYDEQSWFQPGSELVVVDLPFADVYKRQVRCFIEAEAPRVRCPEHGVVVAWVPWARHGAGYSRAFDLPPEGAAPPGKCHCPAPLLALAIAGWGPG